MDSDKKDPVTNEFIERLESKIKESQGINGDILKPKWQNLTSEIDSYFQTLQDKIISLLDKKKKEIISKIEDTLEKETGVINWEKYKEDLSKLRESFNSSEKSSQSQAFDSYFALYSDAVKKLDQANTKTEKKIHDMANFVKFDKKALDRYYEKIEHTTNVLVSDFVSNISYCANDLPPEKLHLSEMISIPHKGCWRALAVFEKQELLFVGGLEGKISIWDARTMTLLDSTQLHENFITSIIYIPEQSYLVSGGAESRIGVIKLDGKSFGKQIGYLDSEGFVSYLCYIDDENLFASVGGDSNVRVYDPQTLKIHSLISVSHKGFVPRGGLVYAKDKKLLICGYEDGTIDFYSLKKKQIVFGIIAENQAYWGLLYNAQNLRLYAHIYPGTVRVWNFEGERPIHESDITIEDEGDRGMALMVVENMLISLSNSNKMNVVDITTKKVIKKIEVPDFKCQSSIMLNKERTILLADENSAKLAVLKFA